MAGMKNSSKNKFPTDEKKLMVSTRQKIVSTTQNEVSFKKIRLYYIEKLLLVAKKIGHGFH